MNLIALLPFIICVYISLAFEVLVATLPWGSHVPYCNYLASRLRKMLFMVVQVIKAAFRSAPNPLLLKHSRPSDGTKTYLGLTQFHSLVLSRSCNCGASRPTSQTGAASNQASEVLQSLSITTLLSKSCTFSTSPIDCLRTPMIFKFPVQNSVCKEPYMPCYTGSVSNAEACYFKRVR